MPLASRGVALALSGGAARCVAHVGVLHALVHAGIPLAGVVGTSGGAVVGALFACGRYTVDEIAGIARDLALRRLAAPRFPPGALLQRASRYDDSNLDRRRELCRVNFSRC